MVRLLLFCALASMACITVAWLVLVVFFPHTDIDSAIGVMLGRPFVVSPLAGAPGGWPGVGDRSGRPVAR